MEAQPKPNFASNLSKDFEFLRRYDWPPNPAPSDNGKPSKSPVPWENPDMSDENESNLVQRREDKRTLEKMRRKLATSGTVVKKSDQSRLGQPGKPGKRIWPIAIGAAALLIALNFGLSNQDAILRAVGAKTESSNKLAPPPGLSLDEQARFWAYAVYDLPKLRARFKVPKGVLIDKNSARTQLDILLAENLGNEVRNEVFVMQQNAPARKPGAKPAKSINAKGK
jgi:hypothetical protein